MHLNIHHFGPADGEPLLAIHGVTSHGRRYVDFAELAVPDRHVLAVDLRGHGHSGWEPPWNVETHLADITETLDAEGVTGPVDVIGHSFGGLLVLALVTASPKRVQRAVLIDPAIALPATFCATRAEEAISFGGWESPAAAIKERETTIAPHGHRFIPQEVADHVELCNDGRYRARFSPAAAVTAWSEMARPAPIPTTTRPVLILRALNDNYVQDDTLLAPLTTALGDQLEVIGLDSAHMIYWEAPDAAAAEIRRFLS